MKELIEDVTMMVNEEAFKVYGHRNSCIASSYCLAHVLKQLWFDAVPFRVETFIWPKRRDFHGGSLGCDPQEPGYKSKPGMWNGHLAVKVDNKWMADPTFDMLANDFMHPTPLVFEINPTEMGDTRISGSDWEGWYKPYRKQWGFKTARAARRWQWIVPANRVIERLKKAMPS